VTPQTGKTGVRLIVLPGDGIGPEITAAACAVLEALDRRHALGLTLEEHAVGLASLEGQGSTLPDPVVQACEAADGVVLGPVSHLHYPPRAQGGLNPSGDLRIRLDLFANIRPSRSRAGLPHWGRTPMDLVIVRENTEGFYSDRNMHLGAGEFMPTPDLALSVRKVSATGSRRIAQAAFELAHAAPAHSGAQFNVLKVTEGCSCAGARGGQGPPTWCSRQLVDSMAALLVHDAQHYDVIVTPTCSATSCPTGRRSGRAWRRRSTPASGTAWRRRRSAPDLAGRDVANPASLVLSAGMLLGWLGRRDRWLSSTRTTARAAVDNLRRTRPRARDGWALGTRAWTQAAGAPEALRQVGRQPP
jgi:3-isopropylmalate dehydrogenase